ncbi:MAG: M1 family metallopeptidase [Flavitalea sp.]
MRLIQVKGYCSQRDNKRKIVSFIISFLLVCLSVTAQKKDDKHPIINVLDYVFDIELNDNNDTLKAISQLHFSVVKESAVILIDLVSIKSNGKGMRVITVAENNRSLPFSHSNDLLRINGAFKAGEERNISIQYKGIPADGLIISKNKYNQRGFFADNWPNRARNWLACIDHPGDKAGADFIVKAPSHYQVVSNGILIEETNLPHDVKLTHWHEPVSLPTKIMTIGVAEFAVGMAGQVANTRSIRDSGDLLSAEPNTPCVPVPVTSWVFPQDRDKGFTDYAAAVEILPFFIKHIAPFPYQKLANVQSKTVFGGMENAGAIFYAESSVTGSRKSEKLIAHEIVHQWFGDMATEADWSHLWLSEGFATYLSLMYLENKYGADTLRKELLIARKKVIAFSKERFKPIVDTSASDYMSLLNPNAYQKAGWVLHMLRKQVGDSLFWKGIRLYYSRFSGKNAVTDDFRKAMEEVSGKNLQQFFTQWLLWPGHPKLDIAWKYDNVKKQVFVTVMQKQSQVFQFPLVIQIEGPEGTLFKSTLIKEKETTYTIPMNSAPEKFTIDPNMSLLYEGDGM